MRPKIDFKNPNYLETYQYRQRLLQELSNNQTKIAALNKYYEINPVDFIQDWMFTYDPRAKISNIPFLLFPLQKDYIQWVYDKWLTQERGLCEKSRDMGITWLCVAFSVWAWLYIKGVKVSFGSRKEALVDRIGDKDSIIEKVRYIIDKLPVYFVPDGYDRKKHASHMKITNPVNGATITGEAGDNIGRGGRSSIYFLDEAAFIERPDKVDAALSENTNVLIKVSTPNGNGNPFYRDRHSGKIDVFVFDWRDDPRKDQAWYDKKCDELDAVIVAQEIDRDYAASTENVVFPAKWVKAAINLKLEDNGPLTMGFDVANEGEDEKCLVWKKGPVVKDIETWKDGDAIDATRKAKARYLETEPAYFNYDVIGVGAAVRAEFPKTMKNVNPVDYARAVSPGMWKDNRMRRDVFVNGKAELFFDLREKFKNTYKHVVKGDKINNDDMISIPNDHRLISELSVIKYEFSSNGLIKIESKEKMKKRGVKSPNIVDALVYASDNKQNSKRFKKLNIEGF
jgi:hypothetical protein